MQKNVLFLTIKGKYFDQILSGEKKIEYREVKPFFIKRFTNKKYTSIVLQNGYTKESRRLHAKIIKIVIENVQIDFFDKKLKTQLYCIHLRDPKIVKTE